MSDADKHVSGKLMLTRLALIDFMNGRRIMSREEAQQLDGQIKRIGLHAAILENRILQLVYPLGQPSDAEELGMSELYATFDGLVDVTKILNEMSDDLAGTHPSDLQAVARRLMELARSSQVLAHEVSSHRWNARAWQERADRLMAAAAPDVAAFEAAGCDGNVHVLGRECPIAG